MTVEISKPLIAPAPRLISTGTGIDINVHVECYCTCAPYLISPLDCIYLFVLSIEERAIMDRIGENQSDMSDELDTSTTVKICQINDNLLREVTGVVEFRKITSLDLHLRSRDSGKIRVIEGLNSLINLRVLNLRYVDYSFMLSCHLLKFRFAHPLFHCFSYNVISFVEGLNTLSNLTELNLAENSIRKLENFEALVKLQRLNLSGNQISRIPENIHKLRSLQVLRCARNELSVLQDMSFLGDISGLSSITLEDNPIMALEQCAPYTVYCVRSLSQLNNVKITPAARESAIKRFNERTAGQRSAHEAGCGSRGTEAARAQSLCWHRHWHRH